jgi:hypothetical protein
MRQKKGRISHRPSLKWRSIRTHLNGEGKPLITRAPPAIHRFHPCPLRSSCSGKQGRVLQAPGPAHPVAVRGLRRIAAPAGSPRDPKTLTPVEVLASLRWIEKPAPANSLMESRSHRREGRRPAVEVGGGGKAGNPNRLPGRPPIHFKPNPSGPIHQNSAEQRPLWVGDPGTRDQIPRIVPRLGRTSTPVCSWFPGEELRSKSPRLWIALRTTQTSCLRSLSELPVSPTGSPKSDLGPHGYPWGAVSPCSDGQPVMSSRKTAPLSAYRAAAA